MRRKSALLLGRLIEAGVLALVCAAPWAFGATSTRYEFFLDVGLAGLAVLWAARILLEGRSTWRWCPVGASLAALVVVAGWQMVPWPGGLLRWIAPATATMYDRLLPDRPEVLPDRDPGDRSAEPDGPIAAGSTLSVDPGATRRKGGRLLAVFLLFAIVRANVDPAGGLRRLSLAALANGSLLALFGLIQAVSSSPKRIYWSYPTAGSPFGPFINRNHFAFYVNVCVGLGFGLLLGRVRAIGARLPARGPGPGRGGGRGLGLGDRSARLAAGLLADPSAIGIVFAIGLMISGVASSLSRGGFLALLGGLGFGLATWVARAGRRSAGGWLVLLAPAVAIALVFWLGYDQIADRLATLGTGEALREQRADIWARALPVVRDFPLWGTGGATYEFADMLHRADARDADTVVDHAHNDYLELLVEGGLAQLVPGVLALVLTFRLGLRAARRLGDSPAGGLATGALVALATVAIHSVTDFGLQIPSCAAMVVVLVAILAGLGDGDGAAGDGAAGDGPAAPEGGRAPAWLRGAAALLGAGLAIALGLLVALEGWRPYRARELGVQASDLDRSGDPTRLERKVALLEEAARVLPENYLLQEDLVSAHLNAFEQGLFEATRAGPAGADGPDGSRPRPSDPERARLRREHLVPALRHLLRSRDLCPMRAMVHMEIADHVGDFVSAEPRAAYLERAKLLAPGDPDLWYRCGAFELEDGRADRAWASWRHSLELSGLRLPEVIDRSARRLEPRELLERVLPEDPDRLMEAADRLPPESAEGRRAFLEKALALLERRPGPPSAEDGHRKATIYRALGRPDEARAAYRSALAREPMRHGWRLELAELSSERGEFDESRQELLIILYWHPEDARARALFDEVTRQIAEGK